MKIFFLLVISITLALSLPNADTFSEKMEVQNAKSMLERAFEFYCSNETNEMINAYNELIDKFAYSTNKEIRLITAQAMSNLALAYESANDTKAEIAVHERIISKFISSNESGIEVITIKSLLRKGFIAFNENDTKAQIETGERFVARFADTNDENLRVVLAGMMMNLGYLYTQTDEYRKAVNIGNIFMEKFENSQNELIREQFFDNSMMLGVSYTHLGEIKNALAAYQRGIDRFKNSTKPNIAKAIGAAVTNKIELEICNNLKPSFSGENRKIADKNEYSAFMYEFLQIIYAAKDEAQTKRLKEWREKYSDFSFEKLKIDFDFSDLDKWQDSLKNPAKKRVKECIDALKEFAKNR
ncbi:MAG: hypothetical protein LBS26_00520 [Campylobacteraceae bacterium]|jgi:hypothetical protein|nr:hypothetical protein [Campylobacteraceae bacterium]